MFSRDVFARDFFKVNSWLDVFPRCLSEGHLPLIKRVPVTVVSVELLVFIDTVLLGASLCYALNVCNYKFHSSEEAESTREVRIHIQICLYRWKAEIVLIVKWKHSHMFMCDLVVVPSSRASVTTGGERPLQAQLKFLHVLLSFGRPNGMTSIWHGWAL